jgi:hypothetical protein
MHGCIPTIAWLDSNSVNATSSFLVKLNDHQNIQTFTDIQPCISYINSHSDEIIYLIVSGSFATHIVPQIYKTLNVPMIFVFCASMKTYTDWAMDFCDKLMMFDHEDDLLQRLWLQIEEYLREQAKQYIKQANECKERARQLKQSCG